MLFNSIEYAVLLAVTFFFYWLTENQGLRRSILLISSLLFYGYYFPPYVLLLVLLLGILYCCAYLATTRSTAFYTVGVVALLFILGFYKYTDFVIKNISSILEMAKVPVHLKTLGLMLPLGISFIVFQMIAYLIDVKHGKTELRKNPLSILLFISFFPHMIAGPICRPNQLLPQLEQKSPFQMDRFCDGLFMILCGFVLKVVFADGFAPYVNVLFKDPSAHSGADNLFGAVGFGLQIFCDFWGYSTMALGSAKLFGIELPYNFNLPYASTSIKEFWRRWHITLSSWLRDYLYISLGGNRNNARWLTYRNLFLTMVLGGLWHGANWTFIVWGAIHGSALMINRWFSDASRKEKSGSPLVGVLAYWLLTMIIVFVSWVYFRAESLNVAHQYLWKIVKPAPGWSKVTLDWQFFELIALFLPVHLAIHHLTYRTRLSRMPAWVWYSSVPALSSLALIYFSASKDFIYFQF